MNLTIFKEPFEMLSIVLKDSTKTMTLIIFDHALINVVLLVDKSTDAPTSSVSRIKHTFPESILKARTSGRLEPKRLNIFKYFKFSLFNTYTSTIFVDELLLIFLSKHTNID